MQSAAQQSSNKHSSGAHGITHQSAPLSWDKGLPLGNGFLGAMFWGDGNPLKLTLDCTELWDERTNTENLKHPDYTYANLCRLISEKRFEEAEEIFGNRFRDPKVLTPTKISIGRAEVSLGQAIRYTARLDLESASIRGALTTKSGRHQFLCFAARERNLICLRIAKISAEAVLRLIPMAEACPAMAGLHHPAPIRQTRAGVEIMTQAIPEGPSYAVVWNQHGPDIFIAVELADTAEKAADKAFSTFAAARQDGIDRLFRRHAGKWKQFWSMSAVFLPEAELEFFWYYGIYLLASAARRGCLPPGLNGVWSVDDGERLAFGGEYANNVNVQETFWPACASGHLELMDTWCDYMHAGLPSRRAYTRRFFGTDGTFWPGALFGRHKFSISVSNWYALYFGWSHSGWLGWMAWLR